MIFVIPTHVMVAFWNLKIFMSAIFILSTAAFLKRGDSCGNQDFAISFYISYYKFWRNPDGKAQPQRETNFIRLPHLTEHVASQISAKNLQKRGHPTQKYEFLLLSRFPWKIAMYCTSQTFVKFSGSLNWNIFWQIKNILVLYVKLKKRLKRFANDLINVHWRYIKFIVNSNTNFLMLKLLTVTKLSTKTIGSF